MIVPDTNLLLYAVDSTSPFHDVAREWWTSCLDGAVPVGLCHPVVFAFARISTNRRAFAHPLSLAQAAGIIRSWSDRQVTRVLYPGPRHVHNVLELLAAAGVAWRQPRHRRAGRRARDRASGRSAYRGSRFSALPRSGLPVSARRLEARRSFQLSQVSENGFLREGTRLRPVGGAPAGSRQEGDAVHASSVRDAASLVA